MTKLKDALTLLVECSILSLIIVFIDFIIFFVFASELSPITSGVSLIVLLEGGLCLVAGGGVVLYTPSIAKLGQVFLTSKPWNATRQKRIEKQMQILIITGLFLVIYGLIISVI